METKSSKEKFWNSHLEYLNAKPMLEKASSEMDTDWMQMLLHDPETVDPFMLSLKNKNDLPTKRNVLVHFPFFRNIEKFKAKSHIADRVLKELTKYWQHSNIPIQNDWWIRQGVLSLNKKYEDILKHIKRNTATETHKRERFVACLDKLFDIASPVAEKELRKDQVLGMKKAKEDLM